MPGCRAWLCTALACGQCARAVLDGDAAAEASLAAAVFCTAGRWQHRDLIDPLAARSTGDRDERRCDLDYLALLANATRSVAAACSAAGRQDSHSVRVASSVGSAAGQVRDFYSGLSSFFNQILIF